MSLSRRALLTAPLLARPLSRARAGESAMLRPGQSCATDFMPLPRERVAFRAEGLAPMIVLPAARARLAALLPMAGRQIAVLGFAADPSETARLDLGAFVGWDGARLRVLALEPLRWCAGDGSGFNTRLYATGDRTRFYLRRDGAAPIDRMRWRRESWTDLLAWRDGETLADAPARVPPPETWQARLSALRARVAARLERPCDSIGEELLALFRPDALPPA